MVLTCALSHDRPRLHEMREAPQARPRDSTSPPLPRAHCSPENVTCCITLPFPSSPCANRSLSRTLHAHRRSMRSVRRTPMAIATTGTWMTPTTTAVARTMITALARIASLPNIRRSFAIEAFSCRRSVTIAWCAATIFRTKRAIRKSSRDETQFAVKRRDGTSRAQHDHRSAADRTWRSRRTRDQLRAAGVHRPQR